MTYCDGRYDVDRKLQVMKVLELTIFRTVCIV